MLVDTHCHLDQINDPVAALNRAKSCGVTGVITMGMGFESCRKNLALAGGYNGITVYAGLGIHPWMIETEDLLKCLQFIENNITKAVCVGEIGLDYWIRPARKDKGARDRQKDIFEKLLMMAAQNDLPVSIHTRGAWEDAFEITSGVAARAVFHWYSGSLDLLGRIIKRGYLISATPAAAYSPKHIAAIDAAPLESILLETDSPVKYGSRVSEPADLLQTLEAVSRIKSVSPEDVLKTTASTAAKFFRL